MSVYKPKGTPFYHYDFQCGGDRFFGSTKRTNRREAEAVERSERNSVQQRAVSSKQAKTSLQIDHVAGRYWNEVGKHHVGADNTWRDLCRLVDYFGETKLLNEIGNDEVTRLVAWRRGHRVIRKVGAKAEDCPLISNATVNRSTIEPLKKLFTRAKKNWGVKFDDEPNWEDHFLTEPSERVRELAREEGNRLDVAMRWDYEPFFSFSELSGLRFKEIVFLKWSEVNWDTGRIQKPGKNGKLVTARITTAIREIIWPLIGHHPKYVFTYVARRRGRGGVKGQRHPMTLNGAKTEWKRLRQRAGVEDFRFHDFRHDFATKLLRLNGNLKLVQRALNHSDIKTTMRYAHVLDSDVAEALEELDESRRKSRSRKLG